MGNPKLLILPIGFALLTVVLTILAWSHIGGSLPLQAEGYRFTVLTPQAANLQPGAAVRAAGIDVGRVVKTGTEGGKAQITVELDPQFAPVHADARVTTRAKSLLGEAYLEIAFGDEGADPIPEGGALPAKNVTTPQTLDDFLAAFDPSTRDDLRRLIAGFSAAVDGRSLDFSDAVGQAAPASAEVADLAQLAAAQRGEIGSLIRDSGAVLSEAGSQQGAIQAVISSGDSLFATSARRQHQLSAIVAALPGFLEETRRTGDAVSGASTELAAAVAAIKPAAPLLEPALASSSRLLPDARKLFDELPPTLRAGERGLPGLAGTLQALRPATRALYPALRELVPAVQFAATDPNFIAAPAANLAGLGNSYVPGPNGTELHYARAVPMIWNEMLAGAEEPLPTSRQNQYPEPGSLGSIGTTTPDAWSCDNLDNPQTVPVIPPGTGAPPCKVQGPWNYRGTTAYFPRLHRADP